MEIKRKPYIYSKMPTIDEIIDEGYDLSFEAAEDMEDDEGNPARWLCSMYLGDSNGPWKTGTRAGFGYGMTMDAAFNLTITSLEEVYDVDFTPKKLSVRNRFDIFLADIKARLDQ